MPARSPPPNPPCRPSPEANATEPEPMRQLFMGIISGWGEVMAHKLRSFLTLFGIVLGAAALVGMLGVVKGLLRGWEIMIYETGGIERISVISRPPPEAQREKAA